VQLWRPESELVPLLTNVAVVVAYVLLTNRDIYH